MFFEFRLLLVWLSIFKLLLKYSVLPVKLLLLSESLKDVVLNIFILLFLKLKVPDAPELFGSPTFKLTLPLKPNKSCFFRMILRIPAVPSAEYLADGEVTTSTFSMDSDGIDRRP